MTVLIVTNVLLSLVALKALSVGSDFNFALWKAYGKEYTSWYFSDKRQFPIPE